MNQIIAATGHRKPLGSYDQEPLIKLVKPVLERLAPRVVISGVALGWDQAVAVAAIELGIPVTAYIPHIGQADQWPKEAVERYSSILGKCEKVVTCHLGGYEPGVMQLRNKRMVDDCDAMLALWDGSPGGTANCIAYAEKKGKPIENLWSLYDFEV
jgi:uncharacterized phage-like protein YoqJ